MKIKDRLRRHFSDRSIYEKRVIVFWIDEREEFREEFESIEIENVKKVVLDERNMFEIKVLLEYEDTSSDYLVYTTLDMESKDNWLLGTYLKSRKFRADFVSLVMEELSIPYDLRYLVEESVDFFRNNRNVERFKQLKGEESPESEEKLIAMVLSAEASLDHVDLEPAFGKILGKFLDGIKIKSEKLFWRISRKLGYKGKEDPRSLAKFLLLSDFLIEAPDSLLSKFQKFDASTFASNLVRIWRSSDEEGYIKVCKPIEDELNIKGIIPDIGMEDLSKVDTFRSVDEILIERMVNVITSEAIKKELLGLIERRLETFWGRKMENEYLALGNAIKLLSNDFFPENISSLDEGVSIYAQRIYKMDQLYRKYHFHASKSEIEVLDKLFQVIEKRYSELSSTLDEKWHQVLVKVENWKAKQILPQWRFFTRKIATLKRKAFLIFSDALRYEIAQELSERIKKVGFEVEIIPMLGVVPSYTQLGMASLIYKKGKVTINESGIVFVDGLNTSGLEGRKKLFERNGLQVEIFDFEYFKNLSKNTMREKLKGVQLAAIYHNMIDRIGDDPGSEGRVFEAAQSTIDELTHLVKRIFDNLGVSEIYITSDHGFLYQEKPIEPWKEIESPSLNAIYKKRRFIISKENVVLEGFYRIDLSYIGSDAFVYIPHGLARIKVQGGGNRFVHGGASLQEIVIPLIRISKSRERESRIKGVEIVKIDEIPSSVFTLKIFKEEESKAGFDIRVYVEDSYGNVISDVKSIKLRENLIYKTTLTLKRKEYDKKSIYYIVIEDPEKKDRNTFPVKINILLFDEFDM